MKQLSYIAGDPLVTLCHGFIVAESTCRQIIQQVCQAIIRVMEPMCMKVKLYGNNTIYIIKIILKKSAVYRCGALLNFANQNVGGQNPICLYTK